MTQYTLSALDLPALHRHAIGFDRVFDELNRSFNNSRADGNYPPFNIAKIDDTHYVVEVAVAGFRDTELDVELKDHVLTVKGDQLKDTESTQPEYLHKGISARSFVRSFTLAEHMEVRAATVQNGILIIALEHVVPEEQKAKKIAITFNK